MKHKFPEIPRSGIMRRNADGSVLVARISRGKQIYYTLPPRTKKPEGRQAENCKTFAQASSAAYRELRDDKRLVLWNKRWQDYLQEMEKLDLPPKYTTLRGYITAELLKIY